MTLCHNNFVSENLKIKFLRRVLLKGCIIPDFLSTTKHPKIIGITLDPKLIFSQYSLLLYLMCKQKKSPHSKVSLASETSYGALSYQISTSRNCKSFKTQFCESLLAAHETQTLNTYTMKPKSFQ